MSTDSERFYNTVLELLQDPDEDEEVNALLNWWNKSVHISLSDACAVRTEDISGNSFPVFCQEPNRAPRTACSPRYESVASPARAHWKLQKLVVQELLQNRARRYASITVRSQ